MHFEKNLTIYFVFILENYDYLRKYLVELAEPERCSSILNWNTGGKVFLDYIILCESLEELKKVFEQLL